MKPYEPSPFNCKRMALPLDLDFQIAVGAKT